MASNKPVIHAQDHRRVGALGPGDPGGADPIDLMLPVGLLAGYGSVDLAVRNPGNLLWYYTCGDPSPGPLLDTSHFDSTPRNLGYINSGTALGGSLYPMGSDAAGWTSANDADFQVMNHTAFGSGDDGSVEFNFDPPSISPDAGYPGAYFGGSNDLVIWGTTGDLVRSVSGWVRRKTSAYTHIQFIFGSIEEAGGHNRGWAPYIDNATGFLHFTGHRADSTDLNLVSPGALLADEWYHLAVTWDGTTYLMYLDGVVVDTATSSSAINSGAAMRIGGFWTASGFFDGVMTFFYGGVDQLSGYSKTLSSDEVQAIFAARGAGTSTTIDTVTIGTGPSSDPAAVHTTGTSDMALFSDGAGGTVERVPTTTVYANGV